MARGKQVYLNFTALVLLGYASGATADNLWTIDIDQSPAPAPDVGPPLSAHASRDPAYLPYQILGIVGSYFIVVLFIGTLLLSCGQRARKRAQMLANSNRGEEMVRPMKTYFDPSPISPQEARTWYSPGRLRTKKSAAASVKSINSTRSPGNESIASFDVGIIEADKQRRAAEMEKLYAAVLAQDERRSQAQHTGNPPEYTQGAPRYVDAPALRHLQQDQYPTSPRSPIKAIYPSDTLPGNPLSPTHYGLSQSYSTTTGSIDRTSAGSSRSTNSSPNKKTRKSVKNLKISAPMMHIPDNDDGARTPLSPRVYIDPGIPPEPPTARTFDTYDSTMWPTTPGTARSSPPEDDYDYPQEEQRDEIHDLPATYSNRGKGRQNFSQPLRLEVPQANAPTASTNNALPFRQLHWNTPSSPLYPYQGQGPFSAGPTKTTFVEVRRERLGAAPLTGMATPYSAYMPFTPLTPVTPHLTTRAERRQREREQRTIQGAITEEDQVVDDKELWDEAY